MGKGTSRYQKFLTPGNCCPTPPTNPPPPMLTPPPAVTAFSHSREGKANEETGSKPLLVVCGEMAEEVEEGLVACSSLSFPKAPQKPFNKVKASLGLCRLEENGMFKYNDYLDKSHN